MVRALYPELIRLQDQLGQKRCNAAIEACAEGYPFPTNLDKEPPVGGMMPESQCDLMKRALAEGWSYDAFETAIAEQLERKQP